MSLLGKLKPRLLLSSFRSVKRQIMSTSDFPADFLLQEMDLVKADTTFLKVIHQEEFSKRFGDFPSVIEVYTEAYLRRLAIVLPLQILNQGVIPIPLILHTGAPESLYLGTGALNNLMEAKLLKEITGRWPYRVLGTLYRGEKLIVDPFVDLLPIQYEQPGIRGDVRLNVLGLSAIKQLNIMSYC